VSKDAPRRRLLARRAAAVAAAGAAMVLVALMFDAAPLFVPAIALLVIGALTPAGVWISARGASAERRLSVERVVEDQELESTIVVRRGRSAIARIELTDPLSGSRMEFAGASSPLRSDREAIVRSVARFPRRGLHRVAPPALAIADPLELARAYAHGGAVQELLVLPRTEQVRWLANGRGRRFELPDGRATGEAFAAADLDGLRPYRQGTPASRIHWPAVARGAGLLERRLRADGDTRPLIALDARTPPTDPAHARELVDAAVRATASLVLELARYGGCGLLIGGDQRASSIDGDLSAWPPAYARLAIVEGGPRAAAPVQQTWAGRRGALIYVAAAPDQRTVSMLNGPGGGQTLLVVPEPALERGLPRGIRGPMLATLSVSGCRGFLLRAGRSIRRPEREAAAS
jgi:uncharacterized protein (DUF58 family)